MATKDFDAMLAETAGIRPTFTVGGQQFTARARLPYKKFVRLMNEMGADESENDESTDKFFRAVLVKGDRQRFIDLLNYEGDDDDDDAHIIDPAQLAQISKWLMGIYTGKAPTSSNSSTDGPAETGAPPRLVSLSSVGA